MTRLICNRYRVLIQKGGLISGILGLLRVVEHRPIASKCLHGHLEAYGRLFCGRNTQREGDKEVRAVGIINDSCEQKLKFFTYRFLPLSC